MALRSREEYQQIYLDELQTRAPELTDSTEGSLIDARAGSTSLAIDEIKAVILDEFAKTFFATSHGPEITGGPDDLERLAVDHFGDEFARPGAVAATGIVTFERPTDDAGDVTIEEGTIVSTAPNAAGTVVRFATLSEVTMTALSINASVEAVLEGTSGNVQSDKVTVIETSLTDSTITVNNENQMTGGSEIETDAEYRETIRELIQSLRGGVAAAIEAAALAVPGIESAKAIETEKVVIEWDIAEEEPVPAADWFLIPYVSLYVADANGEASAELIAEVREAIRNVKALGVRVNIFSGEAQEMDWTASITLNISGPHYAELSLDTTRITDAMNSYVDSLEIGEDFIKDDADDFIMGLFGPTGTDDLESFVTTTPSGNVAADVNDKIIPGDMETE